MENTSVSLRRWETGRQRSCGLVTRRRIAGVVVIMVTSGCAVQVSGAVVSSGPGFFAGAFHGLVAPISFLGSLLLDEISIYSVPNNGGWYDFGFLLGLCAWAGGGAASSK